MAKLIEKAGRKYVSYDDGSGQTLTEELETITSRIAKALYEENMLKSRIEADKAIVNAILPALGGKYKDAFVNVVEVQGKTSRVIDTASIEKADPALYDTLLGQYGKDKTTKGYIRYTLSVGK